MITRSIHSVSDAPLKAAPLAAAIAALTLSLPQPALAGVPEPQCEQLVCTVPLTEELSFEVSADAFVHYDDRLELSGQVIVHTPVQSVTLNEADLVLEAKPGAKPVPYRFYGTARPQMQELPIFGDATPYNYVPVAVVGLVDRATLKGLLEDEDTKLPLSEIPKDPHGDPAVLTDPAYLFFHFQSGLSAEVPLAEWLGLHHLGVDPDTLDFKVPGEQSVTFVLDPAEPYLLLAQDNDMELVDKLSPAHQAAAAGAQVVNAQAAPIAGGGVQDDPETPIPDLGQLAFSALGGIPFDPRNTWGLPEDVGQFKGHLLVDAELPLLNILEVNGTILNRFGEQDGLIGAQFGANGDFGIDFELIPGLDFEFPVLDGTLGMFITQDDAEIYFSGTQVRDYSFLPDFVPLTPFEDTRVAGYISRYKLDESRLMADGRYGLNMANFSRMIGVPLQDLEIARARLTLDKKGVLVSGRTGSSIHPSIGLNSDAAITVWISFQDAADSYVEMSGQMHISGVGLRPVEMRLDRLGLAVNGRFVTPLSRIEMKGSITERGPALTGKADVAFPTDAVRKAVEAARAKVDAAQREVDQLAALYSERVRLVSTERLQQQAELTDARRKLASAQERVDAYNYSISYRYRLISEYRSQISAKYSWYKRQPLWKKPLAWGEYQAYRAVRLLWIGARKTQIIALKAKRWSFQQAANAAAEIIRKLKAAVSNVPINADPRVAPVYSALLTAHQALKAARAELPDLPDPDTRIQGQVLLTLDRNGVKGSLSATADGVAVSGRRVELGAAPKACVDLPGLSSVCARF